MNTKILHGEKCVRVAQTHDWSAVMAITSTLARWTVTEAPLNEGGYVIYERQGKTSVQNSRRRHLVS